MTRVPELRFAGFDGKWEDKKISDIGKITAGGDINKTIIKDKGKYPVIANGDNNNGIVGYYDTDYKIEGPAVTISARGNIGTAIARNYNFTPVVRLLTLKTDHNINFIAENLNRLKIFNESTGVAQLTRPQLSLYKLSLPTIREQEKIGDLFSKIDHLIKSQQELVDQTMALKKSMVQRMFPKKDSLIPEIRFDGDDKKWYKSTSKTIFSNISDKNHPEIPVLSATQEEGMIFRDEFTSNIQYDLLQKKTYKRVKVGDFVIHLRSFQGGFAYSNIEGITSPAYTVIRFNEHELHDDYFWKTLFSSEYFINRLHSLTYGVRDGKNISFKDFSTIKLVYPELEEQEKIGNFFKNLDEKIAKEEKLLDAYKMMKKSLLQKMFV